MKVIVTLNNAAETKIDGDAPIFGTNDYKNGVDSRLNAFGFWLKDWRYGNHSGLRSETPLFIPWGSALTILPLELKQKEASHEATQQG